MFYVYELIDPRDGQVFYVGKGKRDRANAHEREALRGKHSRKCRKIREIIAARHSVTVRKVKYFTSENAAYKFEERHIKSIGLGNLTNVAAGGRGGWAAAIQEAWKSELEIAVLLIKRTNGFKNCARAFAGVDWTKFDFEGLANSLLRRVAKIKGIQWLIEDLAKRNIHLEVIENNGAINAL